MLFRSGVVKLDMEAWFGIFGRSGTPPAVVKRMESEMTKVVHAPDVARRFESGGGRVLRMSVAEADTFVKAEIKRWSSLIREAGITAD